MIDINQIQQLLPMIGMILVGLGVLNNSMSTEENLKDAIKAYVDSAINDALGRKQVTTKPTMIQPQTVSLKEIPQETDTVLNLELKEHIEKALSISQNIDIDSDSRTEIGEQLTKLEAELVTMSKLFGGETSNE